jgi:hypothetical protein
MRIKRKWRAGERPPKAWVDENVKLLAKVARLEARIKTRDQELIKEYGRRQRQQERVNKVQRILSKTAVPPSADQVRREAVEVFAKIYADMMATATDNRVCECLIELGPHTITDARIGGDIDEMRQAPVLYVSLPPMTVRVRVDERLYGLNNKKMPPDEVRRLIAPLRKLGYLDRIVEEE